MESSFVNYFLESLLATVTNLSLPATVLMSLVLWKTCPAAHKILRNTICFLALSFISLKAIEFTSSPLEGSNTRLLQAALSLCVGAAIIRLSGLFIFHILLTRLKIHAPTILEEILVVIAYFLLAMFQFHEAGVPLGEIVTTSAIATAVLAIAMQDTLGNILGGLALQWDHSLKVGDWIRVNSLEGRVVDIKWRAICVETRDWETIVIPNSTMMQNEFAVLGKRTNEPVKWRRSIEFKVDYSVHPDKVISITQQAVRDAKIENVAPNPAPVCVLLDISESTAKYLMVFWLPNPAPSAPTASRIMQHIYTGLNRNGIRLATPRQHLYLTNKDQAYVANKHSQDLTHSIKAISHIDLFQSLSVEELDKLANGMEYRPYAEGDAIFHQGEIDPYLYVLTDGKVDIFITDDKGVENYAFTLNQGDTFGEIGVMTGEARAATVRAASAVECYAIGKEDFAAIILTREEIICEISEIISSRKGHLERAAASISENTDLQEKHSLQDLTDRIKAFFTHS